MKSIGRGIPQWQPWPAPVGGERRYLSRAAAVARTLTTLGRFWESPQCEEPDATGFKGFFYHFLDLQTGRRTWNCELSTIRYDLSARRGTRLRPNTSIREMTPDREIRRLADALYRRGDWQWALAGGQTVSMGWKPDTGFLPFRWEGPGTGRSRWPMPSRFGAAISTKRWSWRRSSRLPAAGSSSPKLSRWVPTSGSRAGRPFAARVAAAGGVH